MVLDLSEPQQRAIALAPKPAAALSFLGSLYITVSVLRSKENRRKAYHRIMLALSLNEMSVSAWQFVGTWAVPASLEEDDGYYLNRGTAATCNAQGFFLVLGLAVPMYYASLSLYAFVAVWNDFCKKALARVERWIHIICSICPLVAAFVVQTRALIVPSVAWCFVQTAPSRSLSAVAFLLFLLWALVIFSMTMVVAVCSMMQRRERRSKGMKGKRVYLEVARHKKSKRYALQAGLYGSILCVSYIFILISRTTQAMSGSILFLVHTIGTILVSSSGFFNFLVFIWEQKMCTRSEEDITTALPSSRTILSAHMCSSRTIQSKISMNSSLNTFGRSAVCGCNVPVLCPGRKRRVSPRSRDIECAVFDGTNFDSSSPWAEFMDDGESDEESNCKKEEHLYTDVSHLVPSESLGICINIDDQHPPPTDDGHDSHGKTKRRRWSMGIFKKSTEKTASTGPRDSGGEGKRASLPANTRVNDYLRICINIDDQQTSSYWRRP